MTPEQMPDTRAAIGNCPWCNAEPRDSWNFKCGSIRPNSVCPSPMQADSCRLALKQATIDQQAAEIARLKAESVHWKANHDNLVRKHRVLHQRTDLSPEDVAKRLGYVEEIDRLQAAIAEARRQVGDFDFSAKEIDIEQFLVKLDATLASALGETP